MATTKAQQKAVNKYVRENYDRINVNLPKGQKAALQAHFEKMGDSSLNAFINRAIRETVARDTQQSESE